MHQMTQWGAAPAQQEQPQPHASWDDLRIFLVCAKQRSFRKASLELGVNSATLSRALDRLEQQLNQKLFVRHQAGLALTDAGRQILVAAQKMELASFDILRRASQANDTLSGTVRVAVTEGPGNFWILPRLIDFQNVYRKLRIDLRCAMEHADVARLEADISVQFDPPTNPDIITRKLGRLHIYPFVSKDYANTYGVPKTKADLRHHRIVQQVAPQVDDTAYARLCELDDLEGVVGIKTNSSTAVLYAVERGAGIGFLPSVSLALGLPLVPLDIGVIHHMDFWLTYHHDLRSSGKHMVVVDWLTKLFDPRKYPCFSDTFIHPRDLVKPMSETGKAIGLQRVRAAQP